MMHASLSGADGKAGFMSSARIGRTMVSMFFNVWFIVKLAIGLCGCAALAIADIYIGGVVLVDMMGQYDKVGWLVSIALSAVLLALMGYAFAKKRIAWGLLIPALILTVPDLAIDARFPTLLLYGHDTVMSSGLIPPHPTFAWRLLEIVFTGITLCGEAGILLIFAWLFMELERAGAEMPRLSKSNSATV